METAQHEVNEASIIAPARDNQHPGPDAPLTRAHGGLSLTRVWYVTGLLTLINVFNYIDRMVLSVLVQPIKQDLGLTDTQIGLLTGFAFVAMYAVVALPLARLADRIGRRPVLAGALAVWSLMTFASGFARSFPQLALARIGVGVGEAGGMPSSHALLSDIYPPGRRAVPISIVTSGAAVGIVIGMTAGGWVAHLYGWRMAFMVMGAPGLVVAAIVAFTLPEPQRAAAADTPTLPFWASLRRLLGIPTYRWIACAHPFYTFVTAGIVSWLPAYYMRSRGMPLQQVGAFFGIVFGVGLVIGGFVGASILQTVTHKAPARALHLAGLLMLAAFPFYLIALFVPSAAMSLGLMLVFSTLYGAAGSPMIAAQQTVVGGRYRALASALSLFFASYVGGGVGPLLIGVGSQAFTPALGQNALRAALAISALAIVASAAFLMLASRRYTADARD